MSTGFSLIWWVLVLPLVGFAIQALLGKAVIQALGPATGKKAMGWLAVLPVAVAFVIGLAILQRLLEFQPESRSFVVTGPDWIHLISLNIPFELIVDPLSVTMLLIVTGVGAIIHLYATGYMADDKDYTRFFTYMNLFVVAMLVLVLGNNLPMLFIGWEGVGLCSYLLIGFWYTDVSNCRAASKAFIVNRLGDWGLTLGFFLILVVVASVHGSFRAQGGRYLSYDQMLPILGQVLSNQPVLATAIALLLFVGAAGKSAQFPLYLWLPDAMAGPTPVSALIHAATMVTSGVVLLNRMHIVFELSSVASAVIVAIGAFTAVFAALVAFGQTDIKKVLAYSTVSQLGYMFLACGAGGYWAGMFHVTTHAFFKALLFLGAGSVIYSMAHDQDMRNYGNLRKYLPITCWTMFAGYLAISGFSIPGVFGFSGFYSKEAVLGTAFASSHAVVNGINVGVIAAWIGLFTAFLTAVYMTRLTFLTFFGKDERWRSLAPRVPNDQVEIHEAAHAAEHDVSDGHEGPDVYGFYFTEEEMFARKSLEHASHSDHHVLDANHVPKEAPISMTFPLIVLGVLSVFAGWYLDRGDLFRTWLNPQPLSVLGHVPSHPTNVNLTLLSAIAALGGIFIGLLVYWRGLPRKEGFDESKWSPFRLLARRQFGYDDTVMKASVDGGGDLARFAWMGIDASLIDGAVNGLAKLAGGLGLGLRRLQNGLIRQYALLMLIGGLFLVGWLALAFEAAQRGVH